MIEWDVQIELPGFAVVAQGSITQGESLGIYGPSGSGKTTLLKTLAGLQSNANGKVSVMQQQWQDDQIGKSLPAYKRHIALVQQKPVFFDHLDMLQNLCCGRTFRKLPEDLQLLDHLLEVLELSPLLERKIHMLSGGEAQRLAIARALYSAPKLLLLDEPMNGLDQQRKDKIINGLNLLRHELRVSMVFISHVLEEHARLADSLATMQAGKQSDKLTVHEAFIDHGINLLDGVIDETGSLLTADGRQFRLDLHRLTPAVGSCVRIMLPAEQLHVCNMAGFPAQRGNFIAVESVRQIHNGMCVFNAGRLQLVAAGPAGHDPAGLYFTVHDNNLIELGRIIVP